LHSDSFSFSLHWLWWRGRTLKSDWLHLGGLLLWQWMHPGRMHCWWRLLKLLLLQRRLLSESVRLPQQIWHQWQGFTTTGVLSLRVQVQRPLRLRGIPRIFSHAQAMQRRTGRNLEECTKRRIPSDLRPRKEAVDEVLKALSDSLDPLLLVAL
jgi:hypothetical protein